MDAPTTTSALLADLKIKRREARREYKCHFGAANICRQRHSYLGGGAALASLIAGSAFLARVTGTHPVMELLPAALSLIAAACMAVVTFNRFMELAEKHYSAGRRWEEYRDKCQALVLRIQGATDQPLGVLLEAYADLSSFRHEIRRDAPGYPERLFRKHEHIWDKTELEISESANA